MQVKTLKEFFVKIKSIKHWEIYLALVLVAVVLLAVFISGDFSSKKNIKTADDNSYICQMEHKIVSVVERIEGCGKATVAISYDSDEEKVYAYETETITSGDTVKQTSNIVYVKGEPLVIKTLTPNILGVVIVAEGADNPVIKMKITEAVITLLGVDSSKVQVFTYKS